jgi:hypothetical protein
VVQRIWWWLDHASVVLKLRSGLSSPLVARLNKGGDPWVPSHAKMKISRMPVRIDLTEVRVPEGFVSMIHWAHHAWRLLIRKGFIRAHPCFSLTVWFQRECFEALLAVNIMGHVLVPWC